jgi:outer membrane protein
MTPLIALALIAAAANEPHSDTVLGAHAEAASPSDWSVTIGAGAVGMPSYPGAASMRVMPMPIVDVQYRHVFFLSTVSGLGMNVIATRTLMAGFAVSPDLGRSASAADRLRGWGDISPGADLKLFGMYSLGPVALVANVIHQLSAGNGTLVDGGLTSTLPISRRFTLSATATVSWADARYTRAYFGVDGNQSVDALAHGAALSRYSVGAGPRDAALALFAVIPIDDHWSVQSLVRAEVLLGDAAGSPLTEKRVQPTVGGFVAYRL